MQAGWVLREEGPDQRYAPENIAEIPSLKGVYIYISAFVSYYYKGKLYFYNDLDDITYISYTELLNA